MSLKNRFDLVIFDWAGTMVDFGSAAPVRALIEAFAAEGMALDEKTARRDMGKAKVDHVRSLLVLLEEPWKERHGSPPGPADVARIMQRLEPLMREHAGRASTLIAGARETVERLRAQGVRIASSTGYTREMMGPVLARAAQQGYEPEHLLCSGDTPVGRPSPLM